MNGNSADNSGKFIPGNCNTLIAFYFGASGTGDVYPSWSDDSSNPFPEFITVPNTDPEILKDLQRFFDDYDRLWRRSGNEPGILQPAKPKLRDWKINEKGKLA